MCLLLLISYLFLLCCCCCVGERFRRDAVTRPPGRYSNSCASPGTSELIQVLLLLLDPVVSLFATINLVVINFFTNEHELTTFSSYLLLSLTLLTHSFVRQYVDVRSQQQYKQSSVTAAGCVSEWVSDELHAIISTAAVHSFIVYIYTVNNTLFLRTMMIIYGYVYFRKVAERAWCDGQQLQQHVGRE
jgi:hypothetical protein